MTFAGHQRGDRTEAALEAKLRTLLQTGLNLHDEPTLERVADAALAASLELCEDAVAGVFLYHVRTQDGERVTAHRQCGEGAGSLLQPKAQLQGHPVFTIPVARRAGAVDGEIRLRFLDDRAPTDDTHSLLETLAAQAASAMDRLALEDSLSRQIMLGDVLRQSERVAERRLRQALDANQLGTWAWDAKTNLLDLDTRAAALFGVPANVPFAREELRTRLVLTDDLSKIPEDFAEILRTSGTYAAEYRVHHPDGSIRWIASHGISSNDETGTPAGLIGTVQDITARRSQEDLLRQSEKLAATGRLAATIAHEINNPLEAVTNLIYLAKTDPITPTPVSRLLETADEELNRVSHIAQQTLGFYRDTTRPVSINLNQLLQAVVDLFARKLASKRVRVTLDLDADLGMVGLQGEIRQVVSNLLVNAIDASPATGSTIRIRGRHRRRDGNDGVAMLFTDAGTGIPDHLKSRLFTPFQTTKQDSGTGLGLWVTRGIVEKHGGRVAFRSRTAHPAGTCFRVFLPRNAAFDANKSPSDEVVH